MARKITIVSDLSGKEITDEKNLVKITVAFPNDSRRSTYVAEAVPEDTVVKTIMEKGTAQARRGRRPKEQATA